MSKLLKDLYSIEYINSLALNISKFYPNFDIQSFINNIFNSSWNKLELKQRIDHISCTININLPLSYTKQLEILIQTYKEFSNKNHYLQNIIFANFVKLYGLDNFDISIKALEIFTINSTAEFAIREFILKYEDKTLAQMRLWTQSNNEHLRRLASEGSRPRLPWAKSLTKYKKDPSKVIQILTLLQDDNCLYVKKSVANNLNDISKDHPQIVIDIAKKWYGQNEHKNWIIKHALRTLLKEANQEVLNIFGYKIKKDIKIENFTMNNSVKIGDYLNFSFDIKDINILKKLRIEYSIDFLRQNNSSNNKVFFITQKNINNKIYHVNKKHSFKIITTRKYYTGLHRLNIIINGIIVHKKEFNLIG